MSSNDTERRPSQDRDHRPAPPTGETRHGRSLSEPRRPVELRCALESLPSVGLDTAYWLKAITVSINPLGHLPVAPSSRATSDATMSPGTGPQIHPQLAFDDGDGQTAGAGTASATARTV